MSHLLEFFLHLVDTAGYAGLFCVMVAGNLAIPVGTEIVLPTVGALVARGHLPSAIVAGFIATLGELVGGSILYSIGRYGGPIFITRFGRYVHLRERELTRVHDYFERFGAKVVFFSRFLPVIRGIVALPAGVSGMPWRTFLAYTAAGSMIFCFGMIYIGESLGRNLDTILPLIHKFALVVVIAVLVVAAFLIFRSRSRVGSSDPV